MQVILPRSHFFRIRERSLTRGILLALGAFLVSLRLAGFPYIEKLHGSAWQILIVPFACWGMVETARCLRTRWNFYHAGVMILLYTELMILAMVLAFWAIL
jgi:CO dehydrogenase/acetyl-CoA synthase gamma subunit (corrinoid Fe-S protein)